MSLLKRVFVLLFALVLTACPYVEEDDDYEFEYDIIVTETPANLKGINSTQDDYNSDLHSHYPGTGFPIYFSSTRYGEFDIIKKGLSISYHVKDDVLNVHCTYPEYSNLETALFDLINSDSAELGPLSFLGPEGHSYFFYADNQNGDFDIKYANYQESDFGHYEAKELLNGPDGLEVVNSSCDDLYPTLTEEQSQMFFCSNRENDLFNIYSIQLPDGAELHDFLAGSEPVEFDLHPELSGEGNDKCPFIFNDLLVFTSDREGGYGGFDLYFSRLVEGIWTTPVNFGPAINTEYDEYRPITFSFHTFEHLMIFSSDRPGGLGGFDLYVVKADGAIGSQPGM